MIRDSVDMQTVLDLYGYRVKHGFMCCPFHGEKAPSLKVYPGHGGWHCFGCGKGGSVIDFVMEHEGCGFREAVDAIDQALKLGLRDPRENPIEASQRRKKQEALDDFVSIVYQWCDFHQRGIRDERKKAWDQMREAEEKKEKDVQSLTVEDWDILNRWQDDEDYSEYMIEKIDRFREEVAAWRRKARRTG